MDMTKDELNRFNKILGISAAYSMFPDECMRMEIDKYMKEEEKRYKENYDKIQFGETETNVKVKSPDIGAISDAMSDIRRKKNPNSTVWNTILEVDDSYAQATCDLSKVNNSTYIIKEEEENMAKTTIQWENPSSTLYFKDLAIGEHFKIVSPHAKGAVYRKVLVNKHLIPNKTYAIGGNPNAYAQLEVQVAEVFIPTESPVERVEVGITVKALKPNIY